MKVRRGRAGDATARGPGEPVPVSTALTLVAAAVAAGLDVLGALSAVGAAVGGTSGSELKAVARRIGDGGSWAEAWAAADARWAPLEGALRPCWVAGAAPGASLAATSRALAGRARREGDKAMAELGVALALPLTLCLLPAFALVGIVPMVIAVAMGAGVSLGS
ncbi:type II secretion system F family protein [Demequina aurantiaca]|uniref:type II secretion system F family protein n=1 Tax=Demequina aurantiaca TaxID=676200 RepID=UPI003D3550D5